MGGKFSKRFVTGVENSLLSATHNFSGDFSEFTVRRAVGRLAIMVAVLASGYQFSWEADADQVHVGPIEGGDTDKVWDDVAQWTKREMKPSEHWDCMHMLNDNIERCHFDMFAARKAARKAAGSILPVSAMETMIDLVNVCVARMTQAFLTQAPQRMSFVAVQDWEPWLMELLPTLVPHLSSDCRAVALSQFATTTVTEMYAVAKNFMLADRIMASVASIKLDDAGGNISVGARPHTRRSSPDPDAARSKMQEAIVDALGGAYDRQAQAYVGGRKSAHRIATAVVAALQPTVDIRTT